MGTTRQPLVPQGKSAAEMLQERRGQSLDSDSAMTKLAPEGVDLDPPKANPLEAAVPHMEAVQTELEQIVEVSRRVYEEINKLKETGDATRFLDPRLRADAEMWETKAKEIGSIKNKLLTALPTLG
jgi:hypothetical protein